jgi:hypothetical protein
MFAIHGLRGNAIEELIVGLHTPQKGALLLEKPQAFASPQLLMDDSHSNAGTKTFWNERSEA